MATQRKKDAVAQNAKRAHQTILAFRFFYIKYSSQIVHG